MRPREEYRRLAVGKKIANEPLRAKLGERRERIVARDPPAKGRYGRGQRQSHRRAPAQTHMTAASRQHSALRCNCASPVRTRRSSLRALASTPRVAPAGQMTPQS